MFCQKKKKGAEGDKREDPNRTMTGNFWTESERKFKGINWSSLLLAHRGSYRLSRAHRGSHGLTSSCLWTPSNHTRAPECFR